MSRKQKKTLYTIGYEGADVDRFLATLTDVGVATVADVRAVALSRKKGFSKNQLRENLAEAGIGYRHFIDLGTPKAGREAARAGATERMHAIFCEQLATPGRRHSSNTSRSLPKSSRSASSASSATRPNATAASSPSGSRSGASRRSISW